MGGQVTHIAVVTVPQDPDADLAPGVTSGVIRSVVSTNEKLFDNLIFVQIVKRNLKQIPNRQIIPIKLVESI